MIQIHPNLDMTCPVCIQLDYNWMKHYTLCGQIPIRYTLLYTRLNTRLHDMLYTILYTILYTARSANFFYTGYYLILFDSIGFYVILLYSIRAKRG